MDDADRSTASAATGEAAAEAVLQEAADLLRRDPAAARDLAQHAAEATGSAVVRARADYLTAQTHAIEGDLDRALDLIEQARAAFEVTGLPVEALRTDLGRMHVLNERGRHDEAIRIGEQALLALDELGAEGPADAVPAETTWLRAKIHHNVSVCHAFAGRLSQALEAGERAEEAYVAAGLTAELALVRQNRGEQLLDSGRAGEAHGALMVAAEEFRAKGQRLFESRCLVGIGRAEVLTGRWGKALETFARARELMDGLDVQADVDELLLHIGGAWLALGLHDEALAAYREAEPSLRRRHRQHHLAHALTGIGSALARTGALADADAALAEAAALYQAAGNVPLLARTLLEVAHVQDRRGDRPRARVAAATAVNLLHGGPWAIELFFAHLRAADLAEPDLAVVAEHLSVAASLAQDLQLAPLRFRVDARLGRLERWRGNRAAARTSLLAATEVVETLRAGLPTEALRASFLNDAAAAYVDLVALALDEADARAAFDAAERSKSRGLVDLMTVLGPAVPGREAPSGREGTPGGVAEERVRTLQEELLGLYTRILHAVDGDDGAVRADAVSGRAAEAAGLRRRVLRTEADLRAAHAGLVRLVDPVGAPMPLDDLQGLLRDDVVLIAYHVVEDEVVAFVVQSHGLRAVRAVTRLSTVQPLLRRLDAQWQRFRAGPDFAARHAGRLLGGTLDVLNQLHTQLLAPLGQLPPGARLVVVPHGPLHEVPFHALHDGQRYLLQDHEISTSPSASVFGAASAARPAGGPPLVLGVPDPSAPLMEGEARAVAGVLPHARLRVGADASRAVLRDEAAGSSVVHVACHGLYRPENPVFSSLRLADGWLTAAELIRLDLAGSLVTLSACETARTPSGGAADEVLGLTRAALGAGASAVLASLWLVNDSSTARLASRWYQLLASGCRRAEGLRQAQLEMAADQPHPYYWAPFVLIGAPDADPPTPDGPTRAVHRRTTPEETP